MRVAKNQLLCYTDIDCIGVCVKGANKRQNKERKRSISIPTHVGLIPGITDIDRLIMLPQLGSCGSVIPF